MGTKDGRSGSEWSPKDIVPPTPEELAKTPQVESHVFEMDLSYDTPTETGFKKWEPDGYYEGEPCTCTPACPHACKGQCGCRACKMAWSDAQSTDWD
jgi:hypothetical protein